PEYPRELAQRECQERQQRRIERLLKGSKLPLEKSWPAPDLKRLPGKVAQQLRGPLSGDLLEQRANGLVLGPPGSGQTDTGGAPGGGYCSRPVRCWCRTCWRPSAT